MAAHPTTVTVTETGEGIYTQEVRASNHVFTADEPPLYEGGLDKGPAPYDLLLASLGACTSMTIRMYANQKKWPVEKISVALTHHKDEDKKDIITRAISVTGALDETQRQRLLEIANKCPVHRTLENKPEVISTLEK
jgi:putative redox protein